MSISLMTAAWKSGSPAGQKMVLLALCDNANDQGECRPSVPYLARKCSMAERTVQGHITDMENIGILRREFRTGRSTYYFIFGDKFTTPADIAPLQNLHPTPATAAPTPADFAPQPPQIPHPTPATVAPRTISKPSIESSGKQKKGGQAADDDFSPLAALQALDVPTQTAKDWIAHRKTKKGVITATVLEGFVREAAVAGITVEAALRYSCEANWVGFRADWYLAAVKPPVAGAAPVRGGRPSAFEQGKANAQDAKAMLFGGSKHA